MSKVYRKKRVEKTVTTVNPSPSTYLGANYHKPNFGEGSSSSASATVVIPNTGVSASRTVADYFISPTNGASLQYPFVFVVDANQNFVVQSPAGNNLLGIRTDVYNGGLRYSPQFGSPGEGIQDATFWMRDTAGHEFNINQGGNVKDSFQLKTGGPNNGVQLQFASPSFTALTLDQGQGTGPNGDGGYVTMIDCNFGTFYPLSLSGNAILDGPQAAVGAAAGTGGSVAATLDAHANDLSFQITLVTGNASLSAGILATVTLEAFDPKLVTLALPVKPVISAASANAATVAAKVYCTGTVNTVVISAQAALTANTTYVWNVFGCR